MTAEPRSLFECVDLFAGPGGWDDGIEPLGIRPLGIEWDDAACKTREARGLRTLQADVAELNTDDFDAELLIASPPCQAFSAAGKGDGQKDVPAIMRTARALGEGRDIRGEVETIDPRSLLVVEPLRWAIALRPTFIACEQVPPVLMLWQAFADILRAHGYSCWAGTLTAEAYGVPQTRERSFLMASRVSSVLPPEPTHQTYVFGEPAAEQHMLSGTLAPWVSMAEALGLGMTERPSLTQAFGCATGGPSDGGSGARATLHREREAGRWYDRRQGNTQPDGSRQMVRLIPDTEPAPTISSDGLAKGRDVWVQRERSGERSEEGFDPSEMPSQALTSKARSWTVHRPAPTIVTTRRSKDGLLVGRQMAKGEGENVGGWGYERPATTIAGDSRVFQPGGHHEPGQQSQNAVRVTEAEASILQGFPPDYPWQGSRTKRFEQIGNAVPPPLARAVVTALLGSELAQRGEAIAT